MPHSKNKAIQVKLNSGNLRCSCGQTIECRTEREEKMKLQLHLKNCPDPPEEDGIEYGMSTTDKSHMNYEKFERLKTEQYKEFYE